MLYLLFAVSKWEKFIFVVKVQSTCKGLLNRPLMWTWVVSRTAARYLFARVATNVWRSFSDLLKNWTKFAKKLKKPSRKGMYREQSAFKGLQKNYTATFLKEAIRSRSAICRGHRKVKVDRKYPNRFSLAQAKLSLALLLLIRVIRIFLHGSGLCLLTFLVFIPYSKSAESSAECFHKSKYGKSSKCTCISSRSDFNSKIIRRPL